MENIRKRQGKQHKKTRSTFEVGSKAGNCVPPEFFFQTKDSKENNYVNVAAHPDVAG